MVSMMSKLFRAPFKSFIIVGDVVKQIHSVRLEKSPGLCRKRSSMDERAD